jgi:hypothetical protein
VWPRTEVPSFPGCFAKLLNPLEEVEDIEGPTYSSMRFSPAAARDERRRIAATPDIGRCFRIEVLKYEFN